MSKTFTAKPDTLERDWYLVDATDKTLGRLASEIALRLRGKHKPEYTPNIDTLLLSTRQNLALPAKNVTTRFTTAIPVISAT